MKNAHISVTSRLRGSNKEAIRGSPKNIPLFIGEVGGVGEALIRSLH